MTETKAKILDAAQRVIIGYGADKATLRLIAEEAHVNLAAINYHFGSKDNMLGEIFARLFRPIEEDRIRRLDQAVAAAGNGRPEVEEIVRCYLEPFLDFVRNYPDHNHILYQLHRPDDSWRRFHGKHQSIAGPGLSRFVDAFAKALPDIPRQMLLARMAFMQASISWLLNNAWIFADLKILCGLSLSNQEMVEELVAYTAAGLRGEIARKE
jgi:AcrR family transcriptional regulator